MDLEAERVLDRPGAIMALHAAAQRARQAEVDELVLVAEAAEAFSWVDDVEPDPGETRAVLAGERLWSYGHDGAPGASEFLRFEVGPALGRSPEAAAVLIGEVLDLRHRFPRLWQLMVGGHLVPWAARQLTHVAAPLPVDLAGELDRRLAPFAPGWTPRRLLNRARALVVHLDPEGAEERRRSRLRDRFVTFDHDEGGTMRLGGQLDAGPAAALDATLDRLATVLGTSGVGTTGAGSAMPGDLERRVLRARALEALADPAAAARLLGAAVPGEAGGGSATAAARLELVVHVQPDLLAGGAGGDSPELGALVRSQLDGLLASARAVVVRPVLDPLAPTFSEAYEPPPTMREKVLFRNETVVFPHSNRPSRGPVDLDHTIEWPRGQTTEDNLGPLDRAAHNAKTHGGFRLDQVRAGVFRWRTPCGQERWVTPHGTFPDDPRTRRVVDPVGTRLRARQALARVREWQRAHHRSRPRFTRPPESGSAAA